MSDNTIETIDLTETTRVRVEYEEGPQCPRGDWHMLTGFVKITGEGNSRITDVPAVYDDAIGIADAHRRADEGSWRYVGGFNPYRKLNTLHPRDIVTRWARIFHGLHVEYDREHGGYWFVQLDGPDGFAANWPALVLGSEEHFAHQAKVIEQERQVYEQWAEGEVYGLILERKQTYCQLPTTGTDATGFTVDYTKPKYTYEWDEAGALWGFYFDSSKPFKDEAVRYSIDSLALTDAEAAAARALLAAA